MTSRSSPSSSESLYRVYKITNMLLT